MLVDLPQKPRVSRLVDTGASGYVERRAVWENKPAPDEHYAPLPETHLAVVGAYDRVPLGMMTSPSGKMGLSTWLAKHYADSVSLDSIYRFMDNFHRKRRKVMDVVRRNSESIAGDRMNLMLNVAKYKEIKYGDEENIKYLVIKREDGTSVLSTWSEQHAKKNSFDRQKLIDRMILDTSIYYNDNLSYI
jgi:hypothetical protein